MDPDLTLDGDAALRERGVAEGERGRSKKPTLARKTPSRAQQPSTVDKAARALNELVDAPAAALQKRVDEVTARAKRRPRAKSLTETVLTQDDVDFLELLYGAIGHGGRAIAPEAAQLMRRYLTPAATGPEVVDAEIYSESPRVRKEMARHRDLAAGAAKKGTFKPGSEYTVNAAARETECCGGRKGPPRPSHLLHADEERLKKANNRFYVQSSSQREDRRVQTVFRVTDCYAFEPFSKGFYTDLEALGQKLRIPDGLGEYLTRIGLAATFTYESSWNESWELPAD